MRKQQHRRRRAPKAARMMISKLLEGNYGGEKWQIPPERVLPAQAEQTNPVELSKQEVQP